MPWSKPDLQAQNGWTRVVEEKKGKKKKCTPLSPSGPHARCSLVRSLSKKAVNNRDIGIGTKIESCTWIFKTSIHLQLHTLFKRTSLWHPGAAAVVPYTPVGPPFRSEGALFVIFISRVSVFSYFWISLIYFQWNSHVPSSISLLCYSIGSLAPPKDFRYFAMYVWTIGPLARIGKRSLEPNWLHISKWYVN